MWGVGILIYLCFEYLIRYVECDNEGCIVNILLDIDDYILNIVNVYVFNIDIEWWVFFMVLDWFFLSEFDNIVVGDFNCIMEVKFDKFGGNLNLRNFVVVFLNIIKMCYGLCDIWRFCYRNEWNFIWIGKSVLDNFVIWMCIDFFLISKIVD